MRKSQTLSPCGRETAEGCVQQPLAERGEKPTIFRAKIPLSLILLLNEAKSVPLPQGARVAQYNRGGK